MSNSYDNFIEKVSQCGLLSQQDIRAISADGLSHEGERLAEELVRQNKLTKFQVERVAAGEGRSLILGEYIMLDQLGEGGMGVVYLAEHKKMARQVALKVLPNRAMQDERAIARFLREVKAAAKLSHPNVIAAFDAGEAKGCHYFVMEYVAGNDLSRIVKTSGVLAVHEAIRVIDEVAAGLGYAHERGVIHRDIKPANLLLDAQSNVKILDMGLARLDALTDDDELTRTGMLMGTCDYLAPEQALDAKNADRRADIYSLGCTLFYLLTRRASYPDGNLMQKVIAHREAEIPSLLELRCDVPPWLDALFQKMVAKKPEDRLQSMDEVRAEIARHRAPIVPVATPGSVVTPPLPPPVNPSLVNPSPVTVPPVLESTKRSVLDRNRALAKLKSTSQSGVKISPQLLGFIFAAVSGLLLFVAIVAFLMRGDDKGRNDVTSTSDGATQTSSSPTPSNPTPPTSVPSISATATNVLHLNISGNTLDIDLDSRLVGYPIRDSRDDVDMFVYLEKSEKKLTITKADFPKIVIQYESAVKKGDTIRVSVPLLKTNSSSTETPANQSQFRGMEVKN